MINVPDHVENEEAYIAAAYARIANNARKTTDRRAREDAEFAKVYRTIMERGMEKSEKTFFGSLYATYEKYGKWSDKQIAAVAAILEKEAARKAEMRVRDAGSMHVGTIGERRDFTLTLTGYAMFESMYGYQHLHFFKDADGNVIVYKGSKKLPVEKGASITLKASIKKHDERDSVKQTMIARPSI